MFAIVDVETTGASPAKSKIIEIAIIRHDGNQIIDEFSSLVHPETTIPEWISRLTGITNQMVENAPRFFEVAKKIVELTADCTFVGHNARFDYSFVKKEFAELGYRYRRDTLCTVSLSRKLMPGFPSYKLGELTARLNIDHQSKHRAYGDTYATTKLLEKLITISQQQVEQNVVTEIVDNKLLPPGLPLETVDKLPETCGVYYFYDEAGEIIYIGKSKNIRSRVIAHLRPDHTSHKAVLFKNSIADITTTETGSELIALLIEAAEIKKWHPKYNRRQQRSIYRYGIYVSQNVDGILELQAHTNQGGIMPLIAISSFRSGKSTLERITEKYGLCSKHVFVKPNIPLSSLIDPHCSGVCEGKESIAVYNRRVKKLTTDFSYPAGDFFVVDKGRRDGEKAVVAVQNSQLHSIGFIDEDTYLGSFDDVIDLLTPYKETKDAKQIVLSFLRKKRAMKIIKKQSIGSATEYNAN